MRAQTLRSVGVGANKIMKLFSLENVGFTLKDLYIKIHSDRAVKIVSRDVGAAIAFMTVKKDGNPYFYDSSC